MMAWGRSRESYNRNDLMLPNKVGWNAVFRYKTVTCSRCYLLYSG